MKPLDDALTLDQQACVKRLVEHVVAGGFLPKPIPNRDWTLVFEHKQSHRSVLKCSVSRDGKAHLYLKYFAAPPYSSFLEEALKRDLEEANFRYAGCFPGCERCATPIGYFALYPDGRRVFRCHSEFIETPIPPNDAIVGILEALTTQMAWSIQHPVIRKKSSGATKTTDS